MNYNEIIHKAQTTHHLTHAEIIFLLSANEAQHSLADPLFQVADRVRERYVGNEVHLRGLIEFTNICRRNCLYCGLRSDNKNLTRYRLSNEEIIAFADSAYHDGFRTVVLQGGEDPYFTCERMVRIIKEIKKNDIIITLSIGELTTAEYHALKQAGANRFLLRIETTDRDLYHRLDPNMQWEQRARCLKDIKQAGFELGSGCLVGLPRQTIASLASDILFLKEVEVDMAGIGPFIPNPDTPLKDTVTPDFWLALRVMAITRLLLPDINIPATTAMESILDEGRILALQAGANVVMPNVTEGKYREYYALYPGRICITDSPSQCKNCITQKINSIGRTVSTGYGMRNRHT